MPQAAKTLSLGAFEIMCPNFLSNAWSHARSDTRDFDTLGYWQDLARRLDAGGFDYLFFADASGYPMDGDDVPEVVIREAVQFPVLDQMSLISGLAATVPRLGFVVTASTTIERPYIHARRFSTLDHLTAGRIGWNIVTSDMQESLVKLLGEPSVVRHDERYDRATEFVELCLQLWETAWDDGAFVFDKRARTAIDPSHVHRLKYQGKFHAFDGYYPVNPSPQRTPALFQAGSSPRGLRFGGDFAECVFIQKRDSASTRAMVDAVRSAAAESGRARDSVKVINSVSVVVADTEERAHEIRAELEATPSIEALAAHYLGYSSINLMNRPRNSTLDGARSENGQSSAAKYQNGAASPTVGEILAGLPKTTGGLKITGTPEHAAEQLITVGAQADLDGFLIERTFGGVDCYDDFIERVMPILRDRGAIPEAPADGTLRERLTGSADLRLPGSVRDAGLPPA
ncbi:NtaA/DmoA family FMN-dependent monooxygenase [Gordonia sp. DT219]|uniref:NtaA/DmoA family FMN-dependent monooxygenase n=1 Tax=Gordonia sp. DT219 TaxID=3416658 RepID=UPI003CEF37FA